MDKRVFLFGWTLLLVGCASRQHAAGVKHNATYAVTQVMTRQVTNAIDLGEGDIEIRQLRRLLLAEPNNLNLRLQLAERYRLTGSPELGIDHYRLAADRFPANGYVVTLLAKALRDVGRGQDAIAVLVSFCNQHSTASPELLSLLGILRDDAGDFPGAERAYRDAIQVSPKLAYLHNNLGYNLLLQAKPKAAVQEFEQALAIEPRSQFANNNLGLALLAGGTDNGEAKEALMHWQSVSGPATAHNNLATVLIQQKRYAEARKELGIALGYERKLPAALENLALVSELDGKPAVQAPARNSFWKRVTRVFIVKSEPGVVAQSVSH
jgi:Flp pilus assembly protein TadD